jgi:hypothetical protein
MITVFPAQWAALSSAPLASEEVFFYHPKGNVL